MKRNISIILNILSLLLIIAATNLIDNLLFFLLAGAIPGTTASVSPLIMVALIIAVGYLLARKTVRLFDVKEEVTKRAMPRKRYARL